MNNISISEEDRQLIIQLHKAYQFSVYASNNDFTREYAWFKGWSSEGGLAVNEYPPATVDDLIGLESLLPAKFAPLYWAYLLGPRCVGMEFEQFQLFPNLPGTGLNSIYKAMIKDQNMHGSLLKRGFIAIGKGADINYDPLCFNIAARKKDGDYEIVSFDHEEILSAGKFIPRKIADNFRHLLADFIAQCEKNKKGG